MRFPVRKLIFGCSRTLVRACLTPGGSTSAVPCRSFPGGALGDTNPPGLVSSGSGAKAPLPPRASAVLRRSFPRGALDDTNSSGFVSSESGAEALPRASAVLRRCLPSGTLHDTKCSWIRIFRVRGRGPPLGVWLARGVGSRIISGPAALVSPGARSTAVHAWLPGVARRLITQICYADW